MSIHRFKSFEKASSKGAFSATDWETFDALTSMSKRESAEIMMRLACLLCDECDTALEDGSALARVIEERDALRNAKII